VQAEWWQLWIAGLERWLDVPAKTHVFELPAATTVYARPEPCESCGRPLLELACPELTGYVRRVIVPVRLDEAAGSVVVLWHSPVVCRAMRAGEL
jgi:hypothetical protein